MGGAPGPLKKTPHFFEVFEAKADSKESQNLPAVLCSDGSILSYKELNERVNQIAHYLLSKKQNLKLENGSLIGLYYNQSAEYIISILAVMKAGLAFMSLSANVEIPPQRLINYLQGCNVKLLLTHSSLKSSPFLTSEPAKQLSPLILDEIAEIVSYPKTNPRIEVSYDQLAYLHSSSGSTGVPKKILIKHRGIYNCVAEHIDLLKLNADDHVAAFADISFDACLIEVMMTLAAGACLYPVPADIRFDFRKLIHFYNNNKISVSIFTPSMLERLKREDFRTLRVIISTGEKVTQKIITNWQPTDKPPLLFINGYGPSEVTIATSMAILKPGNEIHIGNPIRGLRMLVLEEDAKQPGAPQCVMPGIQGELYIAGDGLGDYVDEKLSRERFFEIQDPDRREQKIRVFRTRDAAVVDAKGLFHITKRLDRQIKVHGKLYHPEEVERVLLTYEEEKSTPIKNAYVDVQCSDADSTQLPRFVAYLQLNQSSYLDLHALHCYLASQLTAGMVPSRWGIVNEFPFKVSAKIDIEKLRTYSTLLLQGPSGVKIKDIKSEDKLEEHLADIWREILYLKDKSLELNIDDNFIELGGTSLQLASLLEILRTKYELRLSIEEFLYSPTIAGLVRHIRRSQNKLPRGPDVHLLIEESQGPDVIPLFLIHSLMGDPDRDYEKLKKYLSPKRAVYLIRARGLDNADDMDESLETIATDYIKAMKKIQPRGPYLLGGWSAGGIIAFVMAERLQIKNEQASVMMIDSESPHSYQAKSKVKYADFLLDLFRMKIAGKLSINIDSIITQTELIQKSKQEQINFIFSRVQRIVAEKVVDIKSDTEFDDSQLIKRKLGFLSVIKSLLLAIVNYQTNTHVKDVTLFAASHTQQVHDERLAWPISVPIAKIVKLDGNHESIVLEQNGAKILAKHIHEWCLLSSTRITAIDFESLIKQANLLEDDYLKSKVHIFITETRKTVEAIQNAILAAETSYQSTVYELINQLGRSISNLRFVKIENAVWRSIVNNITTIIETYCKELQNKTDIELLAKPDLVTIPIMERDEKTDSKAENILTNGLLTTTRLDEKAARATFAIGNSDYKSVVMQGGLLVDKTLFIKAIVDDKAKTKLILYPRRFGKSLNLSMARYFFEQTDSKNENSSLFQDKAIWKMGAHYHAEQGQYPVLFITFKDIHATCFYEAKESIEYLLSKLYKQYRELFFSSIFKDDPYERGDYEAIMSRKADSITTENSLKNLTYYLHKAYKKPVIVLIDEYDTPLNASYSHGYYPEAVKLIRSLLCPLLKDNSYIHRAVITGVLHFAKDSIFSDVSNIRVYDSLSDDYATYFGFTYADIESLLSTTNKKILTMLEEYYGGYQFGSQRLFNPWSIVNFIEDNRRHLGSNSIPTDLLFKSYWLNTSESFLIKEMLNRADILIKEAFRDLLSNKIIKQQIFEYVVMTQTEKDSLFLWTFLLLNGYLTSKSITQNSSDNKLTCEFVIPNRELFGFYTDLAKTWFKDEKPNFNFKNPNKPFFLANPSPPLAIGNSDYKSAVTQSSLLIDKTGFIAEIIDDTALVKLILRPRRSGKSSNMSMLKYYFEKTEKESENAVLFQDKAIWKMGKRYQDEQGQYPVLLITFKDVHGSKFSEARAKIHLLLSILYQQYRDLIFKKLLHDKPDEKSEYQEIINCNAGGAKITNALKKLTEYLQKVFDKQVIVLIDEYDTPIHDSYKHNYYVKMINLIRSLLSPLLKENPYLYRAVLTGILRVSEESIFSGLNNIKIYSGLSDAYARHFGLLETEVAELLKFTNIPPSLLKTIKDWYGGYKIGSLQLFNLWSIVNFLKDNYSSSVENIKFHTYWLDSGKGDEFIKNMLLDPAVIQDFRGLMRDGFTKQTINEHTVFSNVKKDIWSFLLLSGYLTTNDKSLKENSAYILQIPNKEIAQFYQPISSDIPTIFFLLDPNQPTAAASYYNREGMMSQAAKRNSEALRFFERAIQLEPQNADYHNNKGDAHTNLKEYEKAIDSYKAAIKLKPGNAKYHNNIGNVYYNLRRYAEALTHFSKAAELDLNNAAYRNDTGDAFYSINQYGKALDCYEAALKLDGNNVVYHYHKAKALVNLRRYGDAINCFEQALRLKANRPFEMSQHEKVITVNSTPTKFDTNDWFYRDDKGIPFVGHKRFKEAIACYEEALKLESNTAPYHDAKGNACYYLQRYKDAIDCYDAAIKAQSDIATYHNNKANVLHYIKRYDDAIVCYQNAIRLKPSVAAYYNNNGNALYRLGRYEEAILYFEIAIMLIPDDAVLHHNKGNVLRNLKRYAEALVCYDKAIALNSKDAICHNNRANVLYQLKSYKNSLDSFNKALASDTTRELTAYCKEIKIIIQDYLTPQEGIYLLDFLNSNYKWHTFSSDIFSVISKFFKSDNSNNDSKDSSKLLHLENNYNLQIIENIIYSSYLTEQVVTMLRVVLQPLQQQTLLKQLTALHLLMQQLNLPAGFILQVNKNYKPNYVFGLLVRQVLIIIDPDFVFYDTTFYTQLNEIKTELKLKAIYLDSSRANATTNSQLPTTNSDCLCVEYMRQFAILPIDTLAKLTSNLVSVNSDISDKKAISSADYKHTVNLSKCDLLPNTLKQILSISTTDKVKLLELRKKHLNLAAALSGTHHELKLMKYLFENSSNSLMTQESYLVLSKKFSKTIKIYNAMIKQLNFLEQLNHSSPKNSLLNSSADEKTTYHTGLDEKGMIPHALQPILSVSPIVSEDLTANLAETETKQQTTFADKIVKTPLYQSIIGLQSERIKIFDAKNDAFIQSDQRQIIFLYEADKRNIKYDVLLDEKEPACNALKFQNGIVILSEIQTRDHQVAADSNDDFSGMHRQMRVALEKYKKDNLPIYFCINKNGDHYTTLVVVPVTPDQAQYRYIDPLSDNKGEWTGMNTNYEKTFSRLLGYVFKNGVSVLPKINYIKQQFKLASHHNNECALHNVFDTLLMLQKGPAADMATMRQHLSDILGNNPSKNGGIDPDDARDYLRPYYSRLFKLILAAENQLKAGIVNKKDTDQKSRFFAGITNSVLSTTQLSQSALTLTKAPAATNLRL